MPSFEEVCDELAKTDTAGLRALHANALKARAEKNMTPLQTSIVTMHAALKEWVNCKEESDEMVFHMDKPGPHFLDDFKRDTVLNLRACTMRCAKASKLSHSRMRCMSFKDQANHP